jgi:elongation factor Ts
LAEVTTAMIKELREATGAGVMDAKRALDETGGDMKKATEIIREQGMAKAEKRSDRETGQGVLEAYIHQNRIGVLVELNCETDFVANTPDFKQLARDIAMQVAAMDPKVISIEDRTPELDGFPDAEVVLMAQPFIKDSGRTIGDLCKAVVARTGENVRVRRFARFQLGG